MRRTSTTAPKPGTKLSIYLPAEDISNLRQEAARQERSVSHLLGWAWRLAGPRIAKQQAAPLPKGAAKAAKAP